MVVVVVVLSFTLKLRTWKRFDGIVALLCSNVWNMLLRRLLAHLNHRQGLRGLRLAPLSPKCGTVFVEWFMLAPCKRGGLRGLRLAPVSWPNVRQLGAVWPLLCNQGGLCGLRLAPTMHLPVCGSNDVCIGVFVSGSRRYENV